MEIISLTATSTRVDPAVLAAPHVHIVSVRTRWVDIQPEAHQMVWDYLDREVDRVVRAGKQVAIRVVHGGRNVPPWVLSAGAQHYWATDPQGNRATQGATYPITVWWDAIYLDAVQHLIAAAGVRYAGAVTHVAVPVANTWTGEWNVYQDPEDSPETLVRLGYTNETLVHACVTLLDAYRAAFPLARLAYAIGPTPAALTGGDRYAPVKTLLSQRPAVHIQANDLSNTTAPPHLANERWSVIADAAPRCGAQMLWHVYADQTYRMNGGHYSETRCPVLKGAIQRGREYGTQYQEIYEVDIVQYPQIMAWAAGLSA